MPKIRLSLVVLASVLAGTSLSSASTALAGAPSGSARPGCAIVTDRSGDTAVDVGAGGPATVPQTDQGLDITGLDIASNANWIGVRLHVTHLDAVPAQTGGELYQVGMDISGGKLLFGVGRYSDTAGVTGTQGFGYAGFQQGTLAPRDISAHDVQLKIDPAHSALTVMASRAALRAIGADTTGYALNITVDSGRQYANELTVSYDNAAGSKPFKLGSRSCLGLPA